ncbi:MAG: hypothetical protein BA874_11240 [Desulfuromonadales bacterium C00003068]|nr:MAG: hypothetical protein BA874_11240 [Desulfuromonadales bacterium C00003068]
MAVIDWTRPELIWFLIGLVLLLAEFTAPGLVIFFFGLGAWFVAATCAFVPLELNGQLGLFLLVSVLSLLFFRKRLQQIFGGRRDEVVAEDEASQFTGHHGRLTESVRDGQRGRIEINGTSWQVESQVPIAAGTLVEVVGKNSITLKVRSIDKGES